ncbi:MAG: hypothetical protein PHQ75_13830, partial [Thermoguttaceae bacterium]|nr:hypothetical protein [Thermoguttaceae bacterium]
MMFYCLSDITALFRFCLAKTVGTADLLQTRLCGRGVLTGKEVKTFDLATKVNEVRNACGGTLTDLARFMSRGLFEKSESFYR